MERSTARKLGFWVVMVFAATTEVEVGRAQLVEDFYGKTCPNVEKIVKQAVTTKFGQTFVTVPGTLRLFFHDCFIEVNPFPPCMHFQSCSLLRLPLHFQFHLIDHAYITPETTSF